VTARAPTSSVEATKSPLSRLLTVGDLADLLQVPPKTIYTWRYKGIGPPAVPVGRYLRFRAEDVASWLEDRAEGPRHGGGPVHHRLRSPARRLRPARSGEANGFDPHRRRGAQT
jgi:excisionase family DNA binding protein